MTKSRTRRKRASEKMASAYQERNAPRVEGWHFTRTERRITWWDGDKTGSEDWRLLAYMFLMVFGVSIGVFVIAAIVTFLFMAFAALFKSESVWSGDDIGILWSIPIMCALVAAGFSAMFAATKIVFKFEFDLEEHQMILHESCFPNRTRVVHVPFSSVEFIRQRKMSSHRLPDLELYYMNARGARVDKTLGKDMDENVLNEHLEWLRPALGDKIHPAVEHDV